MSCQPKVINLTTGWKIKRAQANRRVEQCLSEWVDRGTSIRDLTLCEMVAARSEQSRLRAPIAHAEIPGIKVTGISQNFGLVRAANSFAANA